MLLFSDISRMHYATGTYPLTPAPNELYYALPVPNVTSKSEVPVYSPQVIYSSSQKKVVSPSVSSTFDLFTVQFSNHLTPKKYVNSFTSHYNLKKIFCIIIMVSKISISVCRIFSL